MVSEAEVNAGESEGVTEGARLFDTFLEENGLTLRAAAEALGVSNVTVHHWRTGVKRPRPHQRKKIATWTGEKVPEPSWETESERCEVEEVTPFRPAATGTGD